MPEEQKTSTDESTAVASTAEPLIDQPAAETTPTKEPTAQSLKIPKVSKKKLSLAVLLIIGFVVLVGGSAGAYYGVIVPSKPENVLRTAIKNTALQKKTKFDGKLSYESTDQGSPLKAVNLTIKGQSDSEKSAFQAETEVTASGIKIPFEVRGVDKNLYFKVGDLSSLKGISAATSPGLTPLFDQLSRKVQDKWIEIDETLIKQTQTYAGCALDANYALTAGDVDLLLNQYKAVPFAAVKSSGDTVGGRAAIKYDIQIDDNKTADFAKVLSELSFMKKLKACDEASYFDTSGLRDGDTTPLTLWVNKSSKQIVKIAAHSTAQDEKKDHMKLSFELNLQYGQATITKPEGAVPVMKIFSELTPLLQGTTIPQTLGISTTGDINGVSNKCIQALEDYASSAGAKPLPDNCM